MCGQHRSKGKEACHANSIRKEEAEEYVFKRIGKVLSDDGVVQDLVDKINSKRKDWIKPLGDELIDRASDEQVKNLLRLVIKEITINEDREIDSTKLTFDEKTQEHLLETKRNNNDNEGASDDEDPSSRFTVAI